ncbi:MAG: peptidylprolyl isomerase [Deltaproteobacteria bacterium]|nr:peptidylprolyl isomerase [Deltaproteobacteria bacterium]
MSSNFRVAHKKSNGNLHLIPKGDFDGSYARELIHLMREKYDGKSRVFIDTKDLQEVHSFGCSTFRCRFQQGGVPAHCLFFKGEKGFEMAPDGSKVLVVPKDRTCRCNGNCADCSCAYRKNTIGKMKKLDKKNLA